MHELEKVYIVHGIDELMRKIQKLPEKRAVTPKTLFRESGLTVFCIKLRSIRWTEQRFFKLKRLQRRVARMKSKSMNR